MEKTQNTPSFRPLYDQIKMLIKKGLIDGEWRPGDVIPSEMELAARFKVSQGTVRKAIDSLASENLLVRRQGKGTFVSSHSHERIHTRFLRIVRDDGQREPLESTLLECRREKACETAAGLLDVRLGSPIYTVKRVLAFSGKPVVFDTIHLVASYFKGLELSQIEEFEGSMYSFFETRYGVNLVRAEERLKAVAADAEASELLQVGLGAPLLRVDRVAMNYEDRPMEWRRGLCNSAEHCYSNVLA
jgi:GntR family transcriptional regulator